MSFGLTQKMRIVLVSLLLFVAALTPRMLSIGSGDPQGDEVLWDERSRIFREAIGTGNYSIATSHLGHPAIPAVVAMAAAQHINSLAPFSWQLDDLNAARCGNAVLSACIAPLLFVLLNPLVGLLRALIAGLFIACDPQHVAVSRMAHVDSSFSLFVVASSVLYFLSRKEGRLSLTLGSGAMWGLALACKPTALCLPGAYLGWNIVQRFLLHRHETQLVTWRDAWGVLMGLVVFAAIFTKFWHHHGPFFSEFHIDSVFADWTYELGISLMRYGALWLPLVILSAVAAYQWRNPWGTPLVITVAVGAVALAIVPAVFENYVRYFIRVPWLADYVSKDTGTGNPWLPGGYIGVLLFQLPPVVVVFLLLGIAASFSKFWASRWRALTVPEEFTLFLLVVIAVWIMTLSVSSRSYVRYLVPVLPLVYVFVSIGLLLLVSLCVSARQEGRLGGISACCICGFIFWNTHPNYLNYFNVFFGGVARAEDIHYPLFYEGHEQALRYLDDLIGAEAKPMRVAVVGEYSVIKKAYARVAPNRAHAVEFINPQWAQSADYIVVTEPLFPVSAYRFGQTLQGTEQLFVHSRDGVRFAGLYRAIDISSTDSLEFPLYGLKRDTGGTSLEDLSLGYTERPVLYAMPDRHQPGKLFKGGLLRLSAGDFSVGISVAAIQSSRPDDDKDPPVLTISLGPDCSRTIKRSELPSTITPIRFSCHISTPGKVEVSGEWFGLVPVVVGTLELGELEEEV